MSIYIGNGNKKLGYLTFNLPSQKTCPNMTKQCNKYCYAKKAERIYPQVLPCRNRNLEETKKADFVDNFLAILARKRKTEKNQGVVRFHESGDVYSKDYAIKIIKIAALSPNWKFYLYTRTRFFDGLSIPENLHIIYTVENALDIELIFANTATIIEKNQVKQAKEKKWFVCPGDCTDCHYCVKGRTKVAFIKH